MVEKLKKTKVLYHGTLDIYVDKIKSGIKIKLEEIDEKIGILDRKFSKTLDNGEGFYTALDIDQAKEFAIKQSRKHNLKKKNIQNPSKPVVIKFLVDEELLFNKNTSLLNYSERNIEWAEFIHNNRVKEQFRTPSENHNIDSKYQVVFNKVADHKIFTIIDDRERNGHTSSDIIKRISKDDFGEQVSFHCEKLVNSTLKYEETIFLDPEKQKTA